MDICWQIAVVSSDAEHRRRITTALMRLGIDPVCVSGVSQCRELLSEQQFNLIFCDRVFFDGDYEDILAASHAAAWHPFVVLACRHNHIEYEKALSSGIFGVITEACHPYDVESMVIQTKRVYCKRARTSTQFTLMRSVPDWQTTRRAAAE